VTVNNVTIDCTGHKIGGLNAGPTTQAIGINATERSNVTVTGCNLRGFHTAIFLTGSGHVVERNRIEGSTFRAIALQATPALIRDNFILDTGLGLTVPTDAAVIASGDIDITGNTIAGVDGAEIGGFVYGIHSDAASGNRISGNTVREVTNVAFGNTAAIFIGEDSWYTAVRDNVLSAYSGAGPDAAFGIFCDNSHVHARDNQIFGFAATVSGCTERDNDLQL
jgi:nitrous oxidase accessory protein NosD